MKQIWQSASLAAGVAGTGDVARTVTTEEARGKILSANDAVQSNLVPKTDNAVAEVNPDASPRDGKISRTLFPGAAPSGSDSVYAPSSWYGSW